MIPMIKKDMTNKEKPQLESDIIRQKMLDEVLNENAKLAEKNAKLREEIAKKEKKSAKLREEIAKKEKKSAKLREEIAKLNDEKEKADSFINLLIFTSDLT